LAKARTAAALASEEWLCVVRRDATAAALRALGVPEPKRITDCESFSTMLTLLAQTDMLAVVQHPFLDMPQVAQAVQQVPIAEQLPGLTVGLHMRADAPLTRPAAALARLLSEIGRRLLQRG
jgi:LysR family transcriptional regulator of abg operon